MTLSAAIILAAGEGTRMRSATPKVLHTLAGKTFLERVMASVAGLDPETLAVVVHYQADRVAEAARSYNEFVEIVNQDDLPGTGRAVQCAMRSYSFSISLTGLPPSYSSTICRLKASSNFLGCFGSRIRCSFPLTSDVPHLTV